MERTSYLITMHQCRYFCASVDIQKYLKIQNMIHNESLQNAKMMTKDSEKDDN